VVDFAKPIQTQNAQTEERFLLRASSISCRSRLWKKRRVESLVSGSRSAPFRALPAISMVPTFLCGLARDNRFTMPRHRNLLPLRNWLAPAKEFASTAEPAQYHKYRLLSRKIHFQHGPPDGTRISVISLSDNWQMTKFK
jgi:hypothetical protein